MEALGLRGVEREFEGLEAERALGARIWGSARRSPQAEAIPGNTIVDV